MESNGNTRNMSFPIEVESKEESARSAEELLSKIEYTLRTSTSLLSDSLLSVKDDLHLTIGKRCVILNDAIRTLMSAYCFLRTID